MKKPKLGQNFLVDEAACINIVGALGDIRNRTVVEIGPGHGAITTRLAERAARLHCIELDDSLFRELTFRFRDQPQVTIHHSDVLMTDPAAFVPEQVGEEAATIDVVGNLPYYITSDILLHLFKAARQGLLRRAVVMMQREVAERIAAAPGTSDYGPLSAFTQLHASVVNQFTLGPNSFSPPPEVDSTVLRLDFAPRFDELQVDAEGFNKFLRASFAQKRKTLSNNLRNAGYTPQELLAAWPADIPPQVRSEAVSLELMAKLYRALGAASAAG
ncbi:dimethyladenosine transferase [Bryocella elongata]|uniref:Ribosomal RNA small subunit methyltransferase A n=1 Tax=Bryocella elongata TaxID=863522 RepID=A0A1H5U179_9BACT|nr:16S rRNA (adenine(1518)-N(6)/adenine(1519)-N(6))-dimethyltransferase RsmA [Bryocella elongata]SEF68796.1 dimethyladenosine transferase [Bryocella elongata]